MFINCSRKIKTLNKDGNCFSIIRGIVMGYYKNIRLQYKTHRRAACGPRVENPDQYSIVTTVK